LNSSITFWNESPSNAEIQSSSHYALSKKTDFGSYGAHQEYFPKSNSIFCACIHPPTKPSFRSFIHHNSPYKSNHQIWI